MDSFQIRLLAWYDKHARVLPWRISPQDGKLGVMPDPYHVWLSEVMLQQTTVAAVKSYFQKFIRQWPTVFDLAQADTDDVMKAWAGLGYYSRARNLKACADIIAHEYKGTFPETQAELMALPGVGDYTSAAIAAIAFGKKCNVVDGNIERVVTRHTANATPLPKAKEDCRTFMGKVTPEDRPGDFVQAMMDLGATVCTPKNPACGECPVHLDCAAKQSDTMSQYPVRPAKKPKPTRQGAAFIVQRKDGAIWLHKRPDKGLLGGMAGLPTTGWTASLDGAVGLDAAPFSGAWNSFKFIRHTFTHFHLELEVWHIHSNNTVDEGWWSLPEDIKNEALPTVMKKVVIAALPHLFQERKPK
ncbi:MAG: A/G-specific adenine glycosylase [Rhizobiaceae bacterium]